VLWQNSTASANVSRGSTGRLWNKIEHRDGRLSEEVDGLLDDAAERAEANDRKTVQPRDL